MNDRILRFHEVSRLVGLGRTTIYAGIKAATFPAPVKLSAHAVGWRASDIAAWIASREATGVSTGVSTGSEAA
jgi:prophage regulatory protein